MVVEVCRLFCCIIARLRRRLYHIIICTFYRQLSFCLVPCRRPPTIPALPPAPPTPQSDYLFYEEVGKSSLSREERTEARRNRTPAGPHLSPQAREPLVRKRKLGGAAKMQNERKRAATAAVAAAAAATAAAAKAGTTASGDGGFGGASKACEPAAAGHFRNWTTSGANKGAVAAATAAAATAEALIQRGEAPFKPGDVDKAKNLLAGLALFHSSPSRGAGDPWNRSPGGFSDSSAARFEANGQDGGGGGAGGRLTNLTISARDAHSPSSSPISGMKRISPMSSPLSSRMMTPHLSMDYHNGIEPAAVPLPDDYHNARDPAAVPLPDDDYHDASDPAAVPLPPDDYHTGVDPAAVPLPPDRSSSPGSGDSVARKQNGDDRATLVNGNGGGESCVDEFSIDARDAGSGGGGSGGDADAPRTPPSSSSPPLCSTVDGSFALSTAAAARQGEDKDGDVATTSAQPNGGGSTTSINSSRSSSTSSGNSSPTSSHSASTAATNGGACASKRAAPTLAWNPPPPSDGAGGGLQPRSCKRRKMAVPSGGSASPSLSPTADMMEAEARAASATRRPSSAP